MVPRQNGFHGPVLPATRGTTQGVIISPKVCNVVVDNSIRTLLAMTVEDQRVAQDGLVETVGLCVGVFYAYYGMFGSRDSMTVLFSLFRSYGLAAKVAKSCIITCHVRALRAVCRHGPRGEFHSTLW